MLSIPAQAQPDDIIIGCCQLLGELATWASLSSPFCGPGFSSQSSHPV